MLKLITASFKSLTESHKALLEKISEIHEHITHTWIMNTLYALRSKQESNMITSGLFI